MPIRLKSRMIATFTASNFSSTPKYSRMIEADEDLEDQDELALRDEIRLAGLVDQLGDLEHRPMHGQRLELREDHEAEGEAEQRDDQPAHQQRVAVDTAEELHLREVRAAPGSLRRPADARPDAATAGGSGCARRRLRRPTTGQHAASRMPASAARHAQSGSSRPRRRSSRSCPLMSPLMPTHSSAYPAEPP